MFEADARTARLALESLLEPDAYALPPGFADAVEQFVAELLQANSQVNLTRVVAPEAVARLHLLDSLAALPLLDAVAPARALDLGSGGGVPGIVLALARPRTAWTLVDSVGKKVEVLRAFSSALGLTSVEAIAERAEILGRDPQHRERYDLVTARACAALPVLVEYALPFLRMGGTLISWKGRLAPEELRAGASASFVLGGGAPTVHGTGQEALGDHQFVVVRKLASTPANYPRRPGEAARRPLGAV